MAKGVDAVLWYVGITSDVPVGVEISGQLGPRTRRESRRVACSQMEKQGIFRRFGMLGHVSSGVETYMRIKQPARAMHKVMRYGIKPTGLHLRMDRGIPFAIEPAVGIASLPRAKSGEMFYRVEASRGDVRICFEIPGGIDAFTQQCNEVVREWLVFKGLCFAWARYVCHILFR